MSEYTSPEISASNNVHSVERLVFHDCTERFVCITLSEYTCLKTSYQYVRLSSMFGKRVSETELARNVT